MLIYELTINLQNKTVVSIYNYFIYGTIAPLLAKFIFFKHPY